MNRFFRRRPLFAKLILISLAPFLFLAFNTMQVYDDRNVKFEIFNNQEIYLEELANINPTVDVVKDQRKFSSGFAITKNIRLVVSLY